MAELLSFTTDHLLQCEVLPEDFEADQFADLAHIRRLIMRLLYLVVDHLNYHAKLQVFELSFSFNFVEDYRDILCQLRYLLLAQEVKSFRRVPDER